MNPHDQAKLYQLHHTDALLLLPTITPGSVDALITDPPYSSGGLYKGDRSNPTGTKYVDQQYSGADLDDFSGDNRDQRSFLTWCNLWLGAARDTLTPGGIVALFTDWRQLPTMTDALQVAGYVWRGVVPWYKPSARPQKGRYSAQCEYLIWGSNGPLPVERGVPPLPGFYQATPPRERVHQTQKPLDVMRQLVRIVPERGTILDPFMGSGTTGVAAVLEGRRFIGAEISANHLANAEQRILTAAGERAAGGAQESFDFNGGAA
jgi:site-specific DNA-methyltransferase (adenine-specific)